MSAESTACGECGQIVSPPGAFHPYLYCEMFKKLGVSNQEHYLREYGFVRRPEVAGVRRDTSQIPQMMKGSKQ